MIYFKTDTTLVTGKIIRYNKKNQAKKYVWVSKGNPNNLGWVRFNDKVVMPKESALGNVLSTGAVVTEQVGLVTGNDNLATSNKVKFPISDSGYKITNNNTIENYLSEQRVYTSKAYSDMLVKNEISSQLNSTKDSSNGPFKEYYDTGQLKSEGNYIEGKKDGLWETYYPTITGELMYKGNYKNGEQHGYWEYYYYLHPKIKGDNVLIQFFI